MKYGHDDFDALYEQYNTTLDSESEDKTMTTYRNVLRKTGLEPNGRSHRPGSKTLLVAAIVSTAALMAAAAVYSTSDAFRGVLDIQDANGPVVDKTGMLLKQTEENGNVSVTLRAAVGDSRTLKVLVDVVDNTGKGLAIKQGDSSLSDGEFAIGSYDITKANGDPLQGASNYTILNVDASKSKMTILFEYQISGENITGQTLNLHFKDILQSASLEGTALEMDSNGLYDLVSQFGSYTGSQFRLSDRTDGKAAYLLHLTSSDKSLPLSKDYSGIKVIGATVKDGALYLQGTAGDSAQLDKVLESVVLLRSDGEKIPVSSISRDDDKNAWSVRFDGVNSLDSLKGSRWLYQAGENYHTAYQGTWDFNFKADIQDIAVKQTPNLSAKWDDHNLTITKLEISPYSLFLEYKTDEKTAQRMYPTTDGETMSSSPWLDTDHSILLTMKDGSTVKVEGASLEAKEVDLTAGAKAPTEGEMRYLIDTVIDPAQVASVKIGDKTISLNQ